MFVDNWNYKYGAPKPIFGTFSNTDSTTKKLALPFVCLGEYSNELDVYMDIVDGSGAQGVGTNASQASSTGLGPADTAAPVDNDDNDGDDGDDVVEKTGEDTSTTAENTKNTGNNEGLENPTDNGCSTINETTQSFDKDCEASGYKRIKCVVPNIPIQKWVNVIVSVYQQSVDIYIDGKLVKTCLLYGIPNVDMTKSETSITPYGGFSGWTTMFKYWETPCDPQKAWDIYSAGYSGSWMGNLLGNYSIKVSIVDNATQTAVV